MVNGDTGDSLQELVDALIGSAQAQAKLVESIDTSVEARFDELEILFKDRVQEVNRQNRFTRIILVVAGAIAIILGGLNLDSNREVEQASEDAEHSLQILEDATSEEAEAEGDQQIEEIIQAVVTLTESSTRKVINESICDLTDDEQLNGSVTYRDGQGCVPAN
jgi:hypothetical protein